MKNTNLNKKREFTVPEEYFASLEESILNETKRFEETTAFNVPTDYFSALEANILNSTVKQKQVKARQLWIAASSVAACLILFVVGYTQIINPELKDNVAKNKVDQKLENDVYESLYETYFVEETKKSSNDVTLDNLESFYFDNQLSSNY